MGGSERVFDALAEAFPTADLLCLWNDRPDRYPGRRVEETWLAHTPLRRSKAAALPLLPSTWRHRSGSYDWVLASSHLFAHHVSLRDSPVGWRKLAYVHSPARYLWAPELDRRAASWAGRVVGTPLKALDRRRARELTAVAANSQFVRNRITRAWDVDSVVIYPPVDVARIRRPASWVDELTVADAQTLAALPADFLLGASRLIPYKALDLVVRAGRICGLPVVLAGDGPELERLVALADASRVPVTTLGHVSDALLYALYERCVAYVFPAIEDFGIMPVEAMAAGAAVVCGREGGVVESVVDGVSGSHVDFSDDRDIERGVRAAASLRGEGPRRVAQGFSHGRFIDEIRDFVGAAIGEGPQIGAAR